MIKTVTVIGDGGAFDTHKVNSSFLINDEILYDCGYNVFSELRRLENYDGDFIRRLKTVVISHMDDDHMGSLKSLLFYRYFAFGQGTHVVGNKDVGAYLAGMNKEIKSSIEMPAKIVTYIPSDYNAKHHFHERYNLSIRFVDGVHHIQTFGIIVDDEKSMVAISGDTKANCAFEDAIDTVKRNMKIDDDNMLVFHDYSYWDAPSRQVHACKSDCDIEYSENFRKKAILYHNAKCDIAGITYVFKQDGIEREKTIRRMHG